MHQEKLTKFPEIYPKLLEALKIMDKQRQIGLVADEQQVDEQLYDGFINNDQDRTAMSVVRAADKDEIGSLEIVFKDQRLTKLFPLF